MEGVGDEVEVSVGIEVDQLQNVVRRAGAEVGDLAAEGQGAIGVPIVEADIPGEDHQVIAAVPVQVAGGKVDPRAGIGVGEGDGADPEGAVAVAENDSVLGVAPIQPAVAVDVPEGSSGVVRVKPAGKPPMANVEPDSLT